MPIGRASCLKSSCVVSSTLTLRINKRNEPMSIIVEIRAAEGGTDSKLLVEDQLGIYLKAISRECL